MSFEEEIRELIGEEKEDMFISALVNFSVVYISDEDIFTPFQLTQKVENMMEDFEDKDEFTEYLRNEMSDENWKKALISSAYICLSFKKEKKEEYY